MRDDKTVNRCFRCRRPLIVENDTMEIFLLPFPCYCLPDLFPFCSWHLNLATICRQTHWWNTRWIVNGGSMCFSSYSYFILLQSVNSDILVDFHSWFLHSPFFSAASFVLPSGCLGSFFSFPRKESSTTSQFTHCLELLNLCIHFHHYIY